MSRLATSIVGPANRASADIRSSGPLRPSGVRSDRPLLRSPLVHRRTVNVHSAEYQFALDRSLLLRDDVAESHFLRTLFFAMAAALAGHVRTFDHECSRLFSH